MFIRMGINYEAPIEAGQEGARNQQPQTFWSPDDEMDDSKLLWSDIQKNVCGWSEGRDKEEG